MRCGHLLTKKNLTVWGHGDAVRFLGFGTDAQSRDGETEGPETGVGDRKPDVRGLISDVGSPRL